MKVQPVPLAHRHASRWLTVFAAAVAVLTAVSGCEGERRGAASGPGEEAAMVLVERARVRMGSELRLSAWAADEQAAEDAVEAVFGEFERLDALMSVWRDGSDVVRLNDAAGIGPVRVGSDVREVLQAARRVSEWTGGKFDVTFGALSGLWRFDHDQDDRMPSAAAVLERLPLVDYRDLEVDESAGTAFLKRKGMRVHLGGVGKGYAVDRAASILRARGVADFMIQSGGDLYAGGRHPERSWRVGIRDPRGDEDQSFAALDLSDMAVSTSGDYERFFFSDGRRYHHILDPDLGEPARACRSVTVVTGSAMLADALSTGIFVAGPDAGMALVERLPGVEAVIVTAQNDVLVSSGLRSRLMVLRPPTDAP